MFNVKTEQKNHYIQYSYIYIFSQRGPSQFVDYAAKHCTSFFSVIVVWFPCLMLGDLGACAF